MNDNSAESTPSGIRDAASGVLSSPDTESDPSEPSSVKEGADNAVSRDIFAMDTFMTITCYGERAAEAADAAEVEIKRLDALLSTGDKNSEISNLNAQGFAKLSEDSDMLFSKSLELYNATDGAFDITIYPVIQLWGFTTHDYAVPEQRVLENTLALVGSDKLSYKDGTVTLSQGQGVDLGGIAKGYTSDRVSEIFAEYGLASGLISLGGNVQLYGSKPNGSLWRVGIRDPLEADSAQSIMGVLEAKDCAVITSGGYERFFTDDDGTIYHHIIDPETGCPAHTGIISSTIVSPSGILADALSTAIYIMGLDKAADFWRFGAEDFEMILMTEDGEIYITEGLKGSFSTDYPLHVISR